MATEMKPMNAGVKNIHDSVDARDWEKLWLDTLKEHPTIPTDEGAMIGWFANAIMAGMDSEYRAKEAEVKALREALEPFAKLEFDETNKRHHPEKPIYGINNSVITGDDVLKARSALSLSASPAPRTCRWIQEMTGGYLVGCEKQWHHALPGDGKCPGCGAPIVEVPWTEKKEG